MDTETRIRLLEAGLENTREDLAVARRRIDALETAVVFFMSFTDRGAEQPASATVNLLQTRAAHLRRRKNKENLEELQALARQLTDFAGATSPF